jgi:hypothetical protein
VSSRVRSMIPATLPVFPPIVKVQSDLGLAIRSAFVAAAKGAERPTRGLWGDFPRVAPQSHEEARAVRRYAATSSGICMLSGSISKISPIPTP